MGDKTFVAFEEMSVINYRRILQSVRDLIDKENEIV